MNFVGIDRKQEQIRQKKLPDYVPIVGQVSVRLKYIRHP